MCSTCPITGGELIYDGYEYGVMDGDSYYHSKLDPSLKWEKNMRSFYWELLGSEETWKSNKEIIVSRRYFKIENNGKWQEYFAKISCQGTRLFPIGTPASEVDNILQQDIELRRQRDEEYQRKVESGEIDPLAFPTVTALGKPSFISKDLVKVQPMAPPSGKLIYLDYTTQIGPNKPTYPYNVTAENIKK